MIDVLEIPILAHLEKLPLGLLEHIPKSSDRNYRGFRHIEYELHPDKESIFFYLLAHFEGLEGYHLWDRIIPRSPFAWLVFDWDEPQIEKLYENYQKRYETPLIFITWQPQAEIDPRQSDHPILKANAQNILFYESNDAAAVNQLIARSLHKILEIPTTSEPKPEANSEAE